MVMAHQFGPAPCKRRDWTKNVNQGHGPCDRAGGHVSLSPYAGWLWTKTHLHPYKCRLGVSSCLKRTHFGDSPIDEQADASTPVALTPTFRGLVPQLPQTGEARLHRKLAVFDSTTKRHEDKSKPAIYPRLLQDLSACARPSESLRGEQTAPCDTTGPLDTTSYRKDTMLIQAGTRRRNAPGKPSMPRKSESRACQACRARKTKSDNKYPSYSYYLSIRAPCPLSSLDASSYGPTSLNILHRIDELERLTHLHAEELVIATNKS
jgi:hypothetical protein